jgi:hypothetical protein
MSSQADLLSALGTAPLKVKFLRIFKMKVNVLKATLISFRNILVSPLPLPLLRPRLPVLRSAPPHCPPLPVCPDNRRLRLFLLALARFIRPITRRGFADPLPVTFHCHRTYWRQD